MLITEAKSIVREYQQTIPVRVVALANALGANVRTVSNWPDDTSGMIRVDSRLGGTRDYLIYVNKRHHPNRQRFTIAHEIAHIVLHSHLIGDGITTDGLYRSGLPDVIEWAANRYAGNILMPWKKIEELMAEGISSAEALARRFQVSRSAMIIQLDFSRLPEWEDPPAAGGK